MTPEACGWPGTSPIQKGFWLGKPLRSESAVNFARKKLMRAILGIYNVVGPMGQNGTVEV